MRGVLTACAVVVLAISLPGCASAQPPASGGAPDLSGLTDVTPDYMGTTPRSSNGFNFVTGDGGFSCGGGTGSVSCVGALPGLQNIPTGPMQGPCELGFAKAYDTGASITHNRGVCQGSGGFKVLNPGQKVSYGSTTCGVLPGDVTACTTGAHGFVLQPSGSSSF